METSDSDVQAVRDVLSKFQDGYTRRDTALLQDFATLFIQDQDLEVIGTGGLVPGDEEWCIGPDATNVLVKNDWEGWGDLLLDAVDARIHVLGDVAWLATTGTVKMTLHRDEAYTNYLESIRSVIDDQSVDGRSRVLEILRGGTNTLFEAERGDEYTWPIRFTAVLVRREAGWLFHQMQFSYATTRFPDARNI